MNIARVLRLAAAGAAASLVFASASVVPPAFADPSPPPGAPGDLGGAGIPDPPSALPGSEPSPEAAAPDYRGADWVAASSKNYTVASRPKDHRIRYVVIHVMQGTYEGTKAWFQNPKAQVTTHYIMRSKDGHVTQMVREKDIAWHAGNWDVNTESIGIEHEGYISDSKWFTTAMYESSARLVRNICERYGIPMDRDHIIGHAEVPGADHTDPGKYWDWDRYMKLVRDGSGDSSGGGGDDGVVADDGSGDRVQASADWRTASMAGQYGNGVHVADPVQASDPLWFEVALAESGSYRVYARYPADSGNNPRTPYLVRTTGGLQAVFVDQTSGGGDWVPIGSFDLAAGDYAAVGVSRWTGGEGLIVADAVRLVKE